ncbi:MAG: transcriptional repressor [Armatimonadota bacterium]|nr:transcriptional repressor [Armatimonadota bacterium]
MTESQCNAIQPEEARAFVDRALGRLKEAGLRITGARKQVVQVLATTRKPLGAYGIRDRVVEAGGKIDVVSVYRILNALTDIGLAHHIGAVDGYLACTAGHAHEHETQHLICKSCGCVEEIDIPRSAMEAIDGAGKSGGFKRIRARVEVLGTCSHCA